MVDITEIKEGDKIHYSPDHWSQGVDFENAFVKSIDNKGSVIVIFEFLNGAFTSRMDPKNLFLGWK